MRNERFKSSGKVGAALPPMGLRLRLKASFSLTPYHGESLVILKALKTYGMIVADNGSSWYISGTADPRWNDGDLNQLKTVPGAASWSVDARATIVLPHDGGFKPIEEICRIEAAEQTEVTWGAAFKVCLACPQAQSAIAFDRDDMDNVGEHPSHNQVCDLEITVTGDLTTVAGRSLAELLAVGECAASGPVRELHKRRSEADAVTAIHHHAVFAEDALRIIADKTRAQFPTATRVTCQIVNYESIFEYPLRCIVTV